MMKKALTYLTILAITVLPVQLINASVEVLGMQMSMGQQMIQEENHCMLDMAQQHADSEKDSNTANTIDKSCCDDDSHNCQNCDHCPQVITAMFLPASSIQKFSALKSHQFITSYLSLNGVTQKNLLRPPKTLI